MKRLLGFLVLIMMVISACEGPAGPMGPPGLNGLDGLDGEVTYWKIIDFNIARSSWELIGDPDEIGSYFYYVADVDELTQAIFENGAIICYYRYRDDFGYDVQTPLPYTYYDIFVNQWGEEFPYSVQYSYDVMPGSIAFKVVFSDFYTGENKPPASCNFRLHLIY